MIRELIEPVFRAVLTFVIGVCNYIIVGLEKIDIPVNDKPAIEFPELLDQPVNDQDIQETPKEAKEATT